MNVSKEKIGIKMHNRNVDPVYLTMRFNYNENDDAYVKSKNIGQLILFQFELRNVVQKLYINNRGRN
jgi:hypothetical protein